MRRLDGAGIDSFLPDLPGCNESLAPLESADARRAGAMRPKRRRAHFGATHVLAIRAGALLAPPTCPAGAMRRSTGSQVLRAMLRARTIAAREAGRDETREGLLEIGRQRRASSSPDTGSAQR